MYDNHSLYSSTIFFYLGSTASHHIADKTISLPQIIFFLFFLELENKSYICLLLDFCPPAPSSCPPGTRTARRLPSQPENNGAIQVSLASNETIYLSALGNLAI